MQKVIKQLHTIYIYIYIYIYIHGVVVGKFKDVQFSLEFHTKVVLFFWFLFPLMFCFDLISQLSHFSFNKKIFSHYILLCCIDLSLLSLSLSPPMSLSVSVSIYLSIYLSLFLSLLRSLSLPLSLSLFLFLFHTHTHTHTLNHEHAHKNTFYFYRVFILRYQISIF